MFVSYVAWVQAYGGTRKGSVADLVVFERQTWLVAEWIFRQVLG